MTIGIVDNDFLHKITLYELFDLLVNTVSDGNGYLSALEVSQFVIRKKAKKNPPQKGLDAFLAAFDQVLQKIELISPAEIEIELASELEAYAQREGLNLDIGESQLCAILIHRSIPLLFTGDKRAIYAIEVIFHSGHFNTDFQARIVCLEQAIYWLLERSPHLCEQIRLAICAEKKADTSLSICFSCSSPEINNVDWQGQLRSYIEDLRTRAPNFLHGS